MKNYEDLEIYKMSHELAINTHFLSLKLPQIELYEEGSQLRRASKSIVSNIVEGYGRKKYKNEFIRFLIIAQASCDETIAHLQLIRSIHSKHKKATEGLIDSYKKLGKKIYRFINYVDKNWR